MRIILSPQASNVTRLTLKKEGDTLTINGVELDFSVIPDGATLPAEGISHPCVLGDVSRVDGEIHVTVLYHQAVDARQIERFPEPLIGAPDGVLIINGVIQYA